MNRTIEFTDNAWDDYIYWQTQDKKVLKRINALIKECLRTPFEGTGKPEPLKANLSGFWSRRVDEKHSWFMKLRMNELASFSVGFTTEQSSPYSTM